MIVLSILKGIGIALLVVISVLLLMLLLILFVPVTYRISGYRKEGMEAPVYVNVRLSWLLNLIRVTYIYPDKPYFIVKLLFFTIYNSSKIEADEEAKKDADIDADKSDDSGFSENQGLSLDNITKEEADAEAKPVMPDEKGSDFGKKTGCFSFFKKIGYTIRSFYAKIKDIKNWARNLSVKTDYYLEIFKSREAKEAIALCLFQLKRIYRNIRPGKLIANLLIGTGDPASTGKIFELYSILYPYLGKNVNMMPDFERSVYHGDFLVRGHVISAVLLWAALKIYRDRNIRNLINILKQPDFNNTGGARSGR